MAPDADNVNGVFSQCFDEFSPSEMSSSGGVFTCILMESLLTHPPVSAETVKFSSDMGKTIHESASGPLDQ